MTSMTSTIKINNLGEIKYEKYGDVFEIKTGKGITTKDSSEDGLYPIISGGITPMGFYNESNRKANTVTVSRVGANAGYVNYIDKDFYLNDKCFSLIANAKYSEFLLPKYVYYYTKNIENSIMNLQSEGGVPTINTQKVSNLTIAIPSIKIQSEIVSKLDKLEKMIFLKKEELEKRAIQQEYIIRKLLFNDKYNKIKLKDICKITKGKTPIQKAIPGEFPLVVTTEERKSCNEYQFDNKAVCVPLVSSRGHGIASLNHVYYQEGKFALGNILCAIEVEDNNKLTAKYLYYYLEKTKDYTLVPLMKGGANVSLHMGDINNIELTLPPLDVQEQIIEKLDLLNLYQQKLSEEIEARKQQYEYYRNKLLSFEEMMVNE